MINSITLSKFAQKFSVLFVIAIIFFIVGGLFSSVHAANIDATNKYAQFLDIDSDNDTVNDRINFDPTNGGVTVSASGTTGYAWGETVGWINTNPTNGDVSLTCSSGTGTFDGYWWGENAGWINLSPTNGGVTLTSDGNFDGYAWSENYGWINFSCPGADTCVETSYVCPTSSDDDEDEDDPDPATCSLSADDTTVTLGDPVRISWTTNIPDGHYYTASISPIGTVNSDVGSVVTYPTGTTTYHGLFSGGWVSGTAQCSVIVTVDEENDVPGCTDSIALNYNSLATINNDSCVYPEEEPIYGCMDSEALNYDSVANTSDGSCYYKLTDEKNQELGDGSDGTRNPFAYIVEKKYVVSEGDGHVAITVRRGGRISENLSVALHIEDDTAIQGADYESAREYSIFWNANDVTDRVFTITIIDDNEKESRERFNALLLSNDRVVVDTASIAIKDNDTEAPLAAVIIGLVALLAGLSTLPFRLQNILLAIPSYRKRHQPWGAVYDAKTKQPLDPAYVQLFDQQGNEVASAITDLDGRYGFLVPPGKYYIKVGKTDYVFPSQQLAGRTSDNLYQDLYFGESVEVMEEGAVIAKNIPMDPVSGANWNEEAKRKMKVSQFFSRHDGVAHRVIDILFVAGFGISIYALAVAPVWYNVLVVALYFVLSVIMLLGVTARAYGQIKNGAGRAMAGAVVRAFNAHLDKEVSHRTVGESGRYYMLVQKGDYYVKVEVPMPDGQYRHVHTSPNFKVNNGIIRRDLRIDNEEML